MTVPFDDIRMQRRVLTDDPIDFRQTDVCHHQKKEKLSMLYWAAVFFVIALLAAFLGFGGLAAGAAGVAKILFFVFLVLAVISLIAGRRVPS
jgi:uncharacterized membrane protein YtjA (UPF0391 family)